MKVLAHIHTFNDADIIDQTIGSVLRQTRPVDGIVVVDNASTDRTLEQPSLKNVTVLRHCQNLGTSGSVATGLRFGLEHGYDWVWLFDADSNPEPDALERLLTLYADWPQALQDEIGFLSCLPHNVPDGELLYGGLFTARGLGQACPAPGEPYYPCDFTIWSGCLYRVATVRQIGLPNTDYVLDWGEHEYAYRVKQAGLKAFMVQDAVMRHNIRGEMTMDPIKVQLGPLRFQYVNLPPIRCYYLFRNGFYFGLYVFKEGGLHLLTSDGKEMIKLTAKYLIHPRKHKQLILASVRGIWHGLTGNIAARY
ncbi:MAG: glycosyltransferase [Candidatus Binataceae bacterium]